MHGTASRHSTTDRAVLTHVMLDTYGIGFEVLNDPDRIAGLLLGAAAAADLLPLADPTVYRYPDQGLTGFLPIRESHLAIHTYPEHGYASVDIVSCATPERAERAREHLLQTLGADRYETELVPRGFLDDRKARSERGPETAAAEPGESPAAAEA